MGGAVAHLLLVVLLALGVFVMHTVGHPDGASAGDATGTSHGAPAGDATGTVHVSAAAGVRAPDGVTGAAGREAPAETGSPAPSHDSGLAMDMTTLCVAVLGAWLIAGLVRAALGRRRDRPAALLARLRAGLGPNAPPPRPPDLAQLSVLRI
ncbi:hypothetical protein [Streptomyces sp. NPDC053755]|uniref:hypothetical protein n=1 Tax=Streptomyces sp. NPDC053755 TaxID=3155815 RepID=UPI003421D7BC